MGAESSMKVQINTLVIDDGIRGIMLQTPIEGLEIPPIRTSSGDLSGADGGYVSGQNYGIREIVVNGVAGDFDYSSYAQLRAEMASKLPIRQVLPMTVTTDDSNEYYTEVYLIDFKMDVTPLNSGEFQITLMAPDPYFYLTNPYNNDGWVEVEINKSSGGGYPTPYVLPVEWEAGTTPAIVNNPTNNVINPVIVLEDAWTNPKITNTTTGEYVQVNVSMSQGDELVIDLQRRTIVLNGGSILANFANGSSWWWLVQGNNTIEIESDSGNDGTIGTLKYRIPYLSVFAGA